MLRDKLTPGLTANIKYYNNIKSPAALSLNFTIKDDFHFDFKSSDITLR